jgi:hypothetical protein
MIGLIGSGRGRDIATAQWLAGVAWPHESNH